MTKKNKDYNLEDRVIEFAVRIIRVAESLPKTKPGNLTYSNRVQNLSH